MVVQPRTGRTVSRPLNNGAKASCFFFPYERLYCLLCFYRMADVNGRLSFASRPVSRCWKCAGASVPTVVCGGEQPPAHPEEAHQRPARSQLRLDEPHATGGSCCFYFFGSPWGTRKYVYIKLSGKGIFFFLSVPVVCVFTCTSSWSLAGRSDHLDGDGAACMLTVFLFDIR